MNGIVASAQGVLPRDPELRYTPGGRAVLDFSIAVHDAKRAEGAETEWLKIAVWGEEAEELHAEALLVKGLEVYVEGRIRLNQWAGQDGQQRAGLALSAWKVEILGAIGRRSGSRMPAGVPADDGRRERIAAAAAEGAERAAARLRWASRSARW